LETGQQHLVDGVLLVDIPPELQLQRASHRDGAPTEQIQAIINTQMSREQRPERADWVLDNTEPAATLAPRVLELHQVFLDRIKPSTPSEG
jgi:dephospho-CoA kinase